MTCTNILAREWKIRLKTGSTVFFLSPGYGFGLFSETETEPISRLTAHHYNEYIVFYMYLLAKSVPKEYTK